jgi:hypothetical protein
MAILPNLLFSSFKVCSILLPKSFIFSIHIIIHSPVCYCGFAVALDLLNFTINQITIRLQDHHSQTD